MTASVPPKLCVCICTYKRPRLLRKLLEELARQETGGRFTFAIVVADNDREQSARPVVSDFQGAFPIETVYCTQPEPNIALTRNQALAHATGDFVAFIDDDEYPAKDWLRNLWTECAEHGVAGVLGPVRPYFEEPPPKWLTRGKFCDRPEHPTGTLLEWKDTRTGNVLFRRSLVNGLAEPFRRELGNGGEDQDFFKRMMAQGHRFTWCNEAVAYEVVPPERWKRRYMLKRALLRGQNERHFLNARSLAKSLVAVPLYALALPILLIAGHHHFMKYCIRLLDHAGKLFAALGVKPAGEKYLNG